MNFTKVSPFYLLFVLLCLNACSPKNKQILGEKLETKPMELPDREVPKLVIEAPKELAKPKPYTMLSMIKEDCIGKCPVYKWTLVSDGKMKYTGTKDVKYRGTFIGQLNESQIQMLHIKAMEAGILMMSNRYPERGKIIEEVPTTIVYYRNGGSSKSIVNKHHAPRRLLVFQDYLEELIEASEWRRPTVNDRL